MFFLLLRLSDGLRLSLSSRVRPLPSLCRRLPVRHSGSQPVGIVKLFNRAKEYGSTVLNVVPYVKLYYGRVGRMMVSVTQSECSGLKVEVQSAKVENHCSKGSHFVI